VYSDISNDFYIARMSVGARRKRVERSLRHCLTRTFFESCTSSYDWRWLLDENFRGASRSIKITCAIYNGCVRQTKQIS